MAILSDPVLTVVPPQRDTNDGGPGDRQSTRRPFQHGFMALPAGFADKAAELHG
jgi:hypothetical protein